MKPRATKTATHRELHEEMKPLLAMLPKYLVGKPGLIERNCVKRNVFFQGIDYKELFLKNLGIHIFYPVKQWFSMVFIAVFVVGSSILGRFFLGCCGSVLSYKIRCSQV